MVQDFTIRSAGMGDVEVIARLLTQLNVGEGYDAIADPEAISAALFGEAREVNLNALVALRGDNVIGTLLYYTGYDTLSASVGYHLADMVVSDHARRQGAGRALMRELARLTLAEGKSWVSLTALKQNSEAQAFYTSLGMTRVNVDFFAIGKSALVQM